MLRSHGRCWARLPPNVSCTCSCSCSRCCTCSLAAESS
jgi:hypothetical protein